MFKISKKPPRRRSASREEGILQGIHWSFLAKQSTAQTLTLLFRVMKGYPKYRPETRQSLLAALENPAVDISAAFNVDAGQALLSLLQDPKILDEQALDGICRNLQKTARWNKDHAFGVLEALASRPSTTHVLRIIHSLPFLLKEDSNHALILCQEMMRIDSIYVRLDVVKCILKDHQLAASQMTPFLNTALERPDPLLLNRLVDIFDFNHPDTVQLVGFLAAKLTAVSRYEPLSRLITRSYALDSRSCLEALLSCLKEGLLEKPPTPKSLRELYSIPLFEHQVIDDVFSYESYFYGEIIQYMFKMIVEVSSPEWPEADGTLALSMALLEAPGADSEDAGWFAYLKDPDVEKAFTEAVTSLIEEDLGLARRFLSTFVGCPGDEDDRNIDRTSQNYAALWYRTEKILCRRELERIVDHLELIPGEMVHEEKMEAIKTLLPTTPSWWSSRDPDQDQDRTTVQVHRAQAAEIVLRFLSSPPDQLSSQIVQDMALSWIEEIPRPMPHGLLTDLIAAVTNVDTAERLAESSWPEVRRYTLIELTKRILEDLSPETYEDDLERNDRKQCAEKIQKWSRSLPVMLFRFLARLGKADLKIASLCTRSCYRLGRLTMLSEAAPRETGVEWHSDVTDLLEGIVKLDNVEDFFHLCEDFYALCSTNRPQEDESRFLHL